MNYATIERDNPKRFRTPFNFEIQLEHIEEPSQTVPDQSLSIAEIMKRYATGQPLGGGRDGVYLGEEDILLDTDLQKMELTDREELLDKTRDYIKNTREKFKSKTENNEQTPPTTGDTIPV